MGKKILVPYLDVIMIAFSLQSYSKKTLRKNVPKRARKYKRNVLMPPWHPIILLKSNYVIQYGRRIGKKVYWTTRSPVSN